MNNETLRIPINTVDLTQDLEPTASGKMKARVSAELDFAQGNDDGPLTEAGLFNADPGGVMYNRVVFPPVNKTVDFKLTFVWEIEF